LYIKVKTPNEIYDSSGNADEWVLRSLADGFSDMRNPRTGTRCQLPDNKDPFLELERNLETLFSRLQPDVPVLTLVSRIGTGKSCGVDIGKQGLAIAWDPWVLGI
jgi:hypothetical protein